MNKPLSNSFRLVVTAILIALYGLTSLAEIPSEAEEWLEAIYKHGSLNAQSIRAKWLQDGTAYTILEQIPGSHTQELVRYDTASGERIVLASPAELTTEGAEAPLEVANYTFSPDESWLLLQISRKEADTALVEYWTLGRGKGGLRKVVADASPMPLEGSISPDGGRLIYGDNGNLHLFDFESGESIVLTMDAVPNTVRSGNAIWSPDGKRIAYTRRDESQVPLRPVLIPGDPTYPDVKEVRYSRVGETLPTIQVGVVDADGGETQWLDIEAPEEGFHLGQVGWAMNSDELLIEKRSRGRDWREFLITDVHTGKVQRIYHESDPAWVVASYRVNAGLEWIRDGAAFIVLSEKDGWRRAYVYSRDGKKESVLTPGGIDIIRRVQVDEAGGWFYYYASPENATQQYLYRAKLDGSGEVEQVSPAEQRGWHEYDFSPDARWAIHSYSTFDTPPVFELVELPDHRVVRTLEKNADLREKMRSLAPRATEFFKLTIDEGLDLDAWMIKPPDFNPSRMYPIFVYQYSEPHAQAVLDRWSGAHNYHRVVASLGYLVVCMDSRGTPAPKGAAWRRAVFGSLGPLSTEEQAAGLKELGRTRSYADLSRVGIWGWSGGGSNTLNALFRKPDLYHVGIAVVPKPQPHLYNAWFQEIYMRTPAENPEGYKQSAPINFAEGLKGDLLIIHGGGETNTHIQITEGLVDRLIELDKPFDYMVYPNRNHGLREGKGTPLHVRKLMVRYLLDHLPPGPAE